MADWLNGTMGAIAPSAAIMLSIIFATLGWLYTARRHRSSMRKQHTFNAILTASSNKDYQDALHVVRDYINGSGLPDLGLEDNKEIKRSTVYLLNHYEFLAAGIRNSDISERLLHDSERGTVVRLFEAAESGGFIKSVRDQRKRKAIFEHIEWLYERWEDKKVHAIQRCVELIHGRPLSYDCYLYFMLDIRIAIIALLLFIVLR